MNNIDGQNRKSDSIIQVEEKKKMLTPKRIDLRVPYSEKDEAKALGARWDAGSKRWYTLSSNPNSNELIDRWPL